MNKGEIMSIEDTVLRIVNQNSEVNSVITLQTDLRKDLNVDSFGTVMIINAIEDEFKMTVDERDFNEVVTVSDIIGLLETKYGKKGDADGS